LALDLRDERLLDPRLEVLFALERDRLVLLVLRDEREDFELVLLDLRAMRAKECANKR
jgi:hypothetical protein